MKKDKTKTMLQPSILKDLTYIECAISILHSISGGKENAKVTDAFELLSKRRDELKGEIYG